MIGYVTLGSRDIQKAAPFYDALAKELDTPRMMESSMASRPLLAMASWSRWPRATMTRCAGSTRSR